MADPVAGNSTSQLLIADPDGAFARNCNRTSFKFEHALSHDTLFDLEHLIDLGHFLPPSREYTYWSNGPVGVADPWTAGYRAAHSLEETIGNIARNNSLVLLRHAELHPSYDALFRELFGEIVDLSGPRMSRDVVFGQATILITSPNRLTSYHLDAELNYLVQVAGRKLVHVFPQTDRRIVSAAELEHFHTGNDNGAVYRPEYEAAATVYDLRDGEGIHIPVYAPHWVENGDQVSISISLNYELYSIRRERSIYRLNSWLRKGGVDPIEPGRSTWRDRIKLPLAYGLISLRDVGRPKAPRPPKTVWRPRRRTADQPTLSRYQR